MEYTAIIQSQQRAVLSKALNDQKHADVTFIIGAEQTQYTINRFLLSLISPVFDAMLYNGHMKESKSNSDVIIPDVEPEIFESICNYAYANDPKITLENVLRLLKTCDKYQIAPLSKICGDYFRSCLTENNLCSHLAEASKLNLSNAVLFCMSYLNQLKHSQVQNILTSDGFLEMDLKLMMVFLKTDPLQITEEELWQAVVKWANHQTAKDDGLESKSNNDDMKHNDAANSEEQMLYLLKSIRFLIRFGLMNGNVFATQVVPQNILTSNELISILLYFQNPGAGCGAFSVKRRIDDNTDIIAGIPESVCLLCYRVKVSVCDSKTGNINELKHNFNFFPSKYSFAQVKQYFQSQLSREAVHIWLKFGVAKYMYPVENGKVKLTIDEFNAEKHEKWVELPNDFMHAQLNALCKAGSELFIAIEGKNDDGTWPRAQRNKTIQTGDIIDAKDLMGAWYESLVVFVYPTDSDNQGKCIIHYIGWNRKWDETIDISSQRLAKRHAHTTGPHIPKKK